MLGSRQLLWRSLIVALLWLWPEFKLLSLVSLLLFFIAISQSVLLRRNQRITLLLCSDRRLHRRERRRHRRLRASARHHGNAHARARLLPLLPPQIPHPQLALPRLAPVVLTFVKRHHRRADLRHANDR